MSNVKYEIAENENQIESLIKALKTGAPLDVALQYANISKQRYYYWVALASIAKYDQEEKFIKMQTVNVNSGISFAAIKESIQEDNKKNEHYKSTIGAFVEPSKESMLKYHTSKAFKEFVDKVADIITRCDQARSDIVLLHLQAVREGAIADAQGRRKLVNTAGSQWFLERTLPNVFGRPSDMAITESNKEVEAIQVKFVDPDKKESRDRVKEMEELVKRELTGEEKANA